MRPAPLVALLAAVLGLTTAAPAAAAPLKLFHSPSGNIGCAMFDSKDSTFVGCDIDEHDWALPPRPRTPACRELDYIGGLTLGARGKSRFFCAGDTVGHQGSVLDYGESRRDGRFTCTSRRSGMTCVNRRNGHGLVLSRASYRRF